MEFHDLKTLIQEKLHSIGYELYSVSYSHDKDGDVLSIVVDKDEDIDMNMIVEVSNVLNAYLDEVNPFEKPYTLDVSSLGAEKPLQVEKLASYIDRFIHVHLTNPIKGENIYEGLLKEVNEETIKIVYKNKTRSIELEIAKSNIRNVRLAIKF